MATEYFNRENSRIDLSFHRPSAIENLDLARASHILGFTEWEEFARRAFRLGYIAQSINTLVSVQLDPEEKSARAQDAMTLRFPIIRKG